jgi:hypothetical protein
VIVASAPCWRTLPPVFRAMARWIMMVLLVGYSSSLVFVWWTTRLLPSGIVDHYLGSETGTDAMQFPKSFAEMLTITHTHLLTMAMLFVLSGIMLGLSERVSSRWKLILCVEPFVALLISFTAMWLMRYADPRFAILLALSSMLMALTFYLQSFLVLRELGWRDPA